MLNLRLTDGLTRTHCAERFGAHGAALFDEIYRRAEALPCQLITASDKGVHFTPQGFLVSNALIVRLLDEIE